MRRVRPIACVLFVAALAACDGHTWSKAGTDSAQARNDLQECTRLAEPVVERDRRIDTDIAASRGEDWRRSGITATRKDMSEARTSGRRDEIVAACMRSRGYEVGQVAAE